MPLAAATPALTQQAAAIPKLPAGDVRDPLPALEALNALPVAPALPLIEASTKAYVVGHPSGGGLRNAYGVHFARTGLAAYGLPESLPTWSGGFGGWPVWMGLFSLLAMLGGEPVAPRTLRADCPPWLQELILRCLEVKPERRHQTAAQLAFDLQHPDAVALTDRCLADYRQGGSHATTVQDPGVMCLCYSSWALWEMGRADEALARARQGVALAEQLQHPFSLGQALGFLAVVHLFRGEHAPGLLAAQRATMRVRPNTADASLTSWVSASLQ